LERSSDNKTLMYARITSKYYFNLNSSGKGAVFLRLTVNGKKYQLYPSITVEPGQWNQSGQKVKGHPESYLINDTLDRFKVVCLEAESSLRSELGECTSTQLKTEVNSAWLNNGSQTNKGTPSRFWDFFEWFIQFKGDTGKDQKHTIGEYRRLMGILKNMNPNLEWGDLNLTFYHNLCGYCESERNDSIAYIGKHITALKAVINKAKEENISSAIKVSTKGWKAYNSIKKTPTLSLKELEKLFHLDLTFDPTLDKVRNLFFFACWTGLRPSDFTKLSQANIEGEYIVVRPRKTNRNATVKHDLFLPLSKPIEALIERIGGVPETLSEQHINRQLPILGEMIGMTDPITITTSKLDGTIEEYQEPRFKHLKGRCARKTFATNADVIGLSRQQAMGVTGHSTEKAFNSYLMTDAKQNADAVKTKINSIFKA
jgi:hypothetical protein